MDLIQCGLFILYHKLHLFTLSRPMWDSKHGTNSFSKEKKRPFKLAVAAYFMLNTTQLSFIQDSVLSGSAYYIDRFTFATSIRIQIVKIYKI